MTKAAKSKALPCKSIYTIGHSTHSIEDFIDLLKAFSIETVIDIRSILDLGTARSLIKKI